MEGVARDKHSPLGLDLLDLGAERPHGSLPGGLPSGGGGGGLGSGADTPNYNLIAYGASFVPQQQRLLCNYVSLHTNDRAVTVTLPITGKLLPLCRETGTLKSSIISTVRGF